MSEPKRYHPISNVRFYNPETGEEIELPAKITFTGPEKVDEGVAKGTITIQSLSFSVRLPLLSSLLSLFQRWRLN